MSLFLGFFKNTLVKETFLYGFVGIISKFAPLLTIPIYINYIGIEGFGYLDLYMTIGMAFFILFEMQIVSGVMRDYYESKKTGNLQKLIGSAINVYLFGYLILCSVYSYVYFNFSFESISSEHLLPIVLSVLPQQIFSLVNVVLRMEHKAKSYVLLNLASVVTVITFGITSIFIFGSHVLNILYGILFGQMLIGAISYLIINKNIPISLSSLYIKNIITYGLPIAISTLGGWLLASSGRIILSGEVTAYDLGAYSLSLKVAMIYMVVLQAFRTAWDPYCMKKFGELDPKNTFARSLSYYWLIGLVGALIIYFISPVVLYLLSSNTNTTNRSLIALILLGYFWQGAINIVAVGTAWSRKTYLNTFGTLTGGLTCIFITYYLVKEQGIFAAAIGYAIGVKLSFIIIFLFAQKQVYIPYKKTYLSLVLSLSLLFLFFLTNNI